jgi:3-methyladenine DNA glycosylase AlkC
MADLFQLARSLASKDADQRLVAAEELCQLGADAQPAALALVQASADANEAVREQVVAALDELGPPRRDDVFALAALLDTDKVDVAYWAATLLGRLEGAAVAAVPALAAALGERQHLSVRQRSAWALGQIGSGAAPALAALQQASTNADERLARLANEALTRIRP